MFRASLILFVLMAYERNLQLNDLGWWWAYSLVVGLLGWWVYLLVVDPFMRSKGIEAAGFLR